ncbi:hypothetical protein GON26_01720 [Flavobacterium sp. GA093]|uniref:Uncharacterized protein n=1 Tax=Flavobacterium hydrocarbonoxydans TaxID=2683249 RepID=A0A6I4NPT5_9FLAO|nr:hypothetical protein [Flavobacterium hydrocarbonoxydans]MWB93067.1 hypothetical protein [Flavobacterium hydrocarbonoxydans]
MSWQTATDPDGDAVTYSVYLDTNTNPSTLLRSGISAESFVPTTLLKQNTVYYWKVVAADAKGIKTVSGIFKFTTLATPASLPVRITRKNASNALLGLNTITYDNQKRIESSRFVDKDMGTTSTYSYENEKITRLIEYDDTTRPSEKYVFYYNAEGMVKEEFFLNNTLTYIYQWYHRPDGGKERRCKYFNSGDLVETWYYRLSAIGNVERVVKDNVNAALEDEEYTYSGFDNKQRAVSSHVNYVIHNILMETQGTGITVPNNPTTFIRKQLGTGNLLANQKMEYTYNTKGQVTQTKIFQANTGTLVYTDIIEYQDF